MVNISMRKHEKFSRREEQPLAAVRDEWGALGKLWTRPGSRRFHVPQPGSTEHAMFLSATPETIQPSRGKHKSISLEAQKEFYFSPCAEANAIPISSKS